MSDLGTKHCLACGAETEDSPLTEAELWHYVTTGESRHSGCPDHPWGWHHWDTDEKAPPRIMYARPVSIRLKDTP